MEKGTLLLLLCLLGFNQTTKVEKIRKKVKPFTCTFTLAYTNSTVDMDASSVKCSPRKPSRKNLEVTLVSQDKLYTFNAKININPTAIKEIEVIPPDSMIPGLFLEEFENITTDLGVKQFTHCGGYGGNINGQEERNSPYYQTKAYTESNIELWKNGEVNWAFVSNRDAYKKFGFYTDEKVGVSETDVKMTMKAMKIITEKTGCIKFLRSQNPDKNKPWILLMRESQCTGSYSCTCQKEYLRDVLQNKEIGNLGKPFHDPWWGWEGGCFGGAFFDGLGAERPRKMVISSADISDDPYDVGLLVHELLHGLGLGHTQKRPDRDDYITIMWNDIDPQQKGQFYKCEGPECITHGVPYDCNSIMQYYDKAFALSYKPTMVAKDPKTCNIETYKYILAESDATLLKKMYCDGQTGTGGDNKNLITSPKYPKDYDNSLDEEYEANADEGNVIEIWFTDFDIEPATNCIYDWVQIIDGDGSTELLKKSCGTTKPEQIKSKTKSLTVKFHTDNTETRKGFRAEWKQVKQLTPVDGGWSIWGGWTSCSNNRAGKGDCIKKRSRYCNNPAVANGGQDCEGVGEESAICLPSELMDEHYHQDCKVTGGWTSWGAASTCNPECKSIRVRTCTNPKPFNDKECGGSRTKSEPCTGDECPTSSSGTITSPNYPEEYPNDRDDKWDLKVVDGSKIELSFLDFDIENEELCRYDYVEVLDSDNSQMIKKCGTSLPGEITSKSNIMTVKFHSDESVTSKGFKAEWKQVDASESGVIKSPNYPNHYTAYQDKEYDIEVASGFKIELTFTDFDIEPEENCNYDWVLVLDTDGENIGQKLCGTTKPSQPLKSKGNTMKVKFHSDESENYKGFSATWKKIA